MADVITFRTNSDSDSAFNSVETSVFSTSGCSGWVLTSDVGNNEKIHAVFAKSYENDFLNRLLGNHDIEALNLLIKAVNNRTIERNYFKLYCELLDGSLSEDAFDREIEENQSEYIIDESDDITLDRLKLALKLSEHLKDVESVEDLTSLFSFNLSKVNLLLEKRNG
ncbi:MULTISPECIES: hypothetical protein [Bacteroides]|uniref:hypothetical protein n=1 Tax=Bacteroides TaxID=816 RepID=UPI00259C897F|nr:MULTISPECIES: hypothetical protein [Bacteroides]